MAAGEWLNAGGPSHTTSVQITNVLLFFYTDCVFILQPAHSTCLYGEFTTSIVMCKILQQSSHFFNVHALILLSLATWLTTTYLIQSYGNLACVQVAIWLYIYTYIYIYIYIYIYPTEAIIQRHLQCNISDIRQYLPAR